MARVEVVDASEDHPVPETLTLPDGTRVSEALERYGWAERDGWGIGVFGQEVSIDYVLQDGDRLELCPPLDMSPQEARTPPCGRETKTVSSQPGVVAGPGRGFR